MTWEDAAALSRETLERLEGYHARWPQDQQYLARVLLATYQRGVLQNELKVKS